MNLFEILSGILVFLSYPMYVIRIWQRKITPNIVSWFVWVLISWSILLTYDATEGKGAAYFAIIAATTGCTVTFISAFFNKFEKSLNTIDISCGIVGILSLVLWYFTRASIQYVQYALYLAIIADIMGIIPTARFLRKNPKEDRPLLYVLFSLGYGLSLIGMDSYTFSSCVLPVVMLIAPVFIFVPLIQYRINKKVPLNQWY